MAIDPEISLGVRPPVIAPLQIQSPLEQFAKVQSLRNLMQQGQLGDLGLQEQQIKLAEAQRATKERADFAAYLSQRVNGGAPAATGVAPAPTTAPAPATAPATAGAPAIATDFDLSGPAAAAPGAPLRTLMAPAAAAPPAAVANPDAFGSGTFNYGEILTRFPTIGPGFVKNALEYQKSQAESQVKQHEVNAGNMDTLGRIAVSIRDSKDPEAQFKIGVTDAANRGLIPSPMASQMLSDGYGKHANDIQAFIDQAQNAKDSSEIAKTNLMADQEAQKKAALVMRTINNQDDYETKFLPNVPRSVRAQLGTTFSPELKAVVGTWDVPGAQLPKAALEQIQTDSVKLAAAMKQGPEAAQAAFATLGPESQRIFKDAGTWQEVVKRGLTPEQATTAAQAKATADETARHNLSTESTAKLTASVAAGRLAQERMVNGMKYGPGTQAYWVEQLKDNPDSIKEMPPEFRSSVGQLFKQATGLPLPTALSGATKTQETAARNALDGITFIKNAMQNPEIRAQIGPIMGRLGNAEQALGTAVGLSPQAAALAQELRTRMRYFVFQEGKAVLGGRLPQQLMSQLESSSGSVKMNPDMLQGALNGAEGNAQSVMDNADKERFGGMMRGRETRGTATQTTQTKIFPSGKVHEYAVAHGIDDAAAKKAISEAGYTVQ